MEFVYIVVALVIVALAVALTLRQRRGRHQVRSGAVQEEVPASLGLRDRLAKTRRALTDRLGGVLSRSGFDSEFWSDVEDSLVAADIGVETSSRVVTAVRGYNPESPAVVRDLLAAELAAGLGDRERALATKGSPAVILVVGVNGSGKTTTVAKLAATLQESGFRVLLGAADTFRAAAVDQLRSWADRIGAEIVAAQSGADPAAVAYDSYHAARARGCNVVMIDTAGRLHSKSNLMNELGKVVRVLRREAGAIDEVLLVLDGTTGQNAIGQAEAFTAAVGVTGIVLTKLDGTARGGVAIAVESRLGIPVKFIGVGEGVSDLIPFDPEAFVDALLGA